VVHLSATYVHTRERVQGLLGGADGYLVHPIEPEELVATIRSFIRIRQSEMALRESEERYRLLFNSIDEGFCIVEMLFDENEKPIDYRFLEINPAFEKQTGLIDAKGKRMRELAPKHEEYWFEIYGKIALTGQPARFVNRAEQLHRWYDVYAFRFSQPENRQVAILFNDITEHKQSELALVESEGKFRHVFEDSTVGMSITAPDGRLMKVNRALCAMLGYTESELVGKNFREITNPDDVAKSNDFVHAVISGVQDVINFEKRYFRKDGEVVWVAVNSILIRDPVGQPLYFITLILNITQRKKDVDTIALANRKLALMNDVSYQDIQNKVTALRGYTELSREAKTEAERVSFIEKEDHLLADIHRVIGNTKQYQEMGLIQPLWLPVEHEIQIAAALTSHDPSLSINVALHGLELYVDPLIGKVFFHLIDNAIKHGTGLSRISFSCHETVEGLILVCEDDGAGIDPKKRPTLFLRIVGDKPRFGLFFVSEYLTLGGMSITETSEPGKGARFEITVPKGMYRFAESDEK
jgi:PAS domain S-box-containing protein